MLILLIRRVDMGDVAQVSKVYPVSIVRIGTEDGGSIYLRNVDNSAYILSNQEEIMV
jgi:hypothetical protein